MNSQSHIKVCRIKSGVVTHQVGDNMLGTCPLSTPVIPNMFLMDINFLKINYQQRMWIDHETDEDLRLVYRLS